MHDLIRRQDAIDAISNYTVSSPPYFSAWTDRLVSAIKDDLVDDIENIYPAQQWIPVEVACPELPTKERCAVLWNIGRDIIFGVPYIVMIAGADVPTTLYWTNRGEWRELHDREPYDVIAWMPLPESFYGNENGK